MLSRFRSTNKRKPARAKPRTRLAAETLEAREVPASSFLSLPEFANATSYSLFVPGTGAGAGTLYVAQQANGDVSVAYEQDLGVNDNTYGTNAIGWQNGHTFNNLVGSDKAEFRFTDANGNVVLDFFLDYVSASTAAPSGYKSLGATGGDGSMVLGSASSILDWDTGEAYNLNTFKAAYGSTTVNGVNLLVNSPPADANFNPTDPVTFGAWDYHDWFRVRISASAFGAAGFGSVTIADQHNSPSKIGINSFTPVPPSEPPAPGDTTCVAVGGFTFKDKTVTVQLTNTSTKAETLQQLDLNWPAINGKLTRVKLDGVTIYDKDIRPTSASITTFKGTAAQRTWEAGETLNLVLEFEKKVDKTASNYTVVATVPDCGCEEPPPPAVGSLTGHVYFDANQDHVIDTSAGDGGIDGVTVELLDSTGNVIATTTTHDGGSYQFTNLTAGTYGIRETQPAGYNDGADYVGSLGGITGSDQFNHVTVAAGEDGINYDFTEQPTPPPPPPAGGSLSGHVFFDSNQDGVIDPDAGDVGIDGVVIQLFDAENNLIATATTHDGGFYEFTDLAAGTYVIRQTQPEGYDDGADYVGSLGGTQGEDEFTEILLADGQNGTDYNFTEFHNE